MVICNLSDGATGMGNWLLATGNWQLATGCWRLHRSFTSRLISIESREKIRVSFRQLSVDLQTGVRPPANPFAVVQIRVSRGAVADVRFVVAAARAERPRPAPAAVGLVRNVVLLEKRGLRAPIDAVAHRPQLVRVRAGKPVAERHVAVSRHAQEAEPGAARIRLA